MSGTYSDSNRHRMHEVSDTPRTDKYGGFCAEYHKVNGMTLIQHARQLERENEELRAENESLVQSNLLLRQSIDVLLYEPVNSL